MYFELQCNKDVIWNDETFERKLFEFEFRTTACIGNRQISVIQKLQINFETQKHNTVL